jgi:ATP-dependent helicase Lhr and Lhr-like helicase
MSAISQRVQRGKAGHIAIKNQPSTPPCSDVLDAWFAQQGWQPAPFQRRTWTAWCEGKSGLLHAPTGSGKTLALAGGIWLDALAGNQSPVLWVTPMRALARDTELSLQQSAQSLGLAAHGITWQVARRTGDTSASERARQRKKLPELLIITPESLSLLLSYPESVQQFAQLGGVVVDEWHELIGNKRGVQLQLCLSRLRALRCAPSSPPLRIWGISATLGNVSEAMAALVGAAPAVLVQAAAHRSIEIQTMIPASLARFPQAGRLGLAQLSQVAHAIGKSTSTLVFVNTRAQAELWFQALSAVLPATLQLALHHGALDASHRLAVEAGLKLGTLNCVVATSTLDLGVDFPAVAQCIQIGSPKGLARLLQRAGRSGHAPGLRSILHFVPTHAFELLEIVAAGRELVCLGKRASAPEQDKSRRTGDTTDKSRRTGDTTDMSRENNTALETRSPPQQPFDVLAQHLVTLALAGGFTAAQAFSQVRSAYSYRTLSAVDFRRVLKLIVQGGEQLAQYPEYHRVQCDGVVYSVPSKKIAALHRQNIGTILADGHMQVRMHQRGKGAGATLGTVEESFIARIKAGDRFVFAGRVLELVRVRDLIAYAKPAAGGANVPRWSGGSMPLSSALGLAVRELLGDYAAGRLGRQSAPELQAVSAILARQQQYSQLPATDRLLVEQWHSNEGAHLFIYPFAGRQVHESLAALMAYRFSKCQPNSFAFSINDYGFELLSERPLPIDAQTLQACWQHNDVATDMLAAINAAELARRQFREIARVAGLILQAPPGRAKSVRQLQTSSGLLFDALSRHDAKHILLEQAHAEVLQRQLDIPGLQQLLARCLREAVDIVPISRLSPMAFPLWADRLRASMSTESASARILRMSADLEAETPGSAGETHDSSAVSPVRRDSRAGREKSDSQSVRMAHDSVATRATAKRSARQSGRTSQ